jgi:hypothetical protein
VIAEVKRKAHAMVKISRAARSVDIQGPASGQVEKYSAEMKIA